MQGHALPALQGAGWAPILCRWGCSAATKFGPPLERREPGGVSGWPAGCTAAAPSLWKQKGSLWLAVSWLGWQLRRQAAALGRQRQAAVAAAAPPGHPATWRTSPLPASWPAPPLQLFSKTYAAAARQYKDGVFLEIMGDESKATRQMMINWCDQRALPRLLPQLLGWLPGSCSGCKGQTSLFLLDVPGAATEGAWRGAHGPAVAAGVTL